MELYFIMNNMWFGKVYYMFGFLFLCYGIMVITCAAVTVLLVYFLLCAENYHWQWRAFCTAGASAGYVFANAILYWISRLSFGSLTSGVLYAGYSLLVSFLFFVLTGTYCISSTNFTSCANRDDRNHWFLFKLGICAPNLRLYQGRLNGCNSNPRFTEEVKRGLRHLCEVFKGWLVYLMLQNLSSNLDTHGPIHQCSPAFSLLCMELIQTQSKCTSCSLQLV